MKAAGSRRDRIRAQLSDLKMPGALEAVDDVLTRVDGGGVTASEAIEQLLGAQIMLRNNRRLQAAMRSSRLPAIKTLDDFDFSFQPSIKREQIDSLHELGFLARNENVIFLGPPGVGKTHLAISLAIAAAQSGRRVYYGALADLITSLEEAKTAGQLGRRLKILTYPSLLVIDEIGYLRSARPAGDSGWLPNFGVCGLTGPTANIASRAREPWANCANTALPGRGVMHEPLSSLQLSGSDGVDRPVGVRLRRRDHGTFAPAPRSPAAHHRHGELGHGRARRTGRDDTALR